MPEVEKRIRIACEGAASLPWVDVVPFQGKLKILHREQFDKLRGQILNTGFSAPLIIWRNDGKNFLMDGHQRLIVIKHLVQKEGYDCPPLPVAWVQAANMQEAYRKCLSIASQYGRVDKEGLKEFMVAGDLGPEAVDEFNFQEVDSEEFQEEYFGDPEAEPPDPTDTPPDTGPPEPAHKCPSCGHQFDD